jgi:hypothetical protein
MNRVGVGVAVLALALAGGFGLVNLGRGASRQLDKVRSNDEQPFEVRYGGGADLLDVDPRFTLATLAFVRGGDTYSIVTGPRVHTNNPYTLHFMITYFVGRLQPARDVSPDEARWILCYGCDPGAYPGFAPVWSADNIYFVLRRRA